MPDEDTDRRVELPEPSPEPWPEPVDEHRAPLDDDEDGRWLDRDDPRRVAAEHRRGRPFDLDDVAAVDQLEVDRRSDEP